VDGATRKPISDKSSPGIDESELEKYLHDGSEIQENVATARTEARAAVFDGADVADLPLEKRVPDWRDKVSSAKDQASSAKYVGNTAGSFISNEGPQVTQVVSNVATTFPNQATASADGFAGASQGTATATGGSSPSASASGKSGAAQGMSSGFWRSGGIVVFIGILGGAILL
jgi:hypothetical protein